ncbi:PREDICTED: putative uncharacterized protein C19orf35 homolog [Colobus angolensis palliatus]|uniref:putative uncharacterized protein C19orf35 homolog n=1 Tax=Colobus angolensis palliatus TaxID=336983 RepID=UPI0005F4584B|nr:PREDICTED: putative uncharacterized protein C19orf35 homolog [Colobus angolensis palliatus]
MSSPETPTELPEPDDPTWSTQPTYSNLGEIRAHLLPSKACRPRTPGSLSTDPQPLPPPLPKKILTRTQSLPNRRTPHASSIQVQLPRRPFLESHSVDESQAEVGPACPPAELTFGLTDAPLGLSVRNLHSPEAVHAALAARQLQGLRAIYARLRARLMGGHPGPCRPGHGFRLLDSSPCVESGDALYYRVVRVHEDAWHILVAKGWGLASASWVGSSSLKPGPPGHFQVWTPPLISVSLYSAFPSSQGAFPRWVLSLSP